MSEEDRKAAMAVAGIILALAMVFGFGALLAFVSAAFWLSLRLLIVSVIMWVLGSVIAPNG
jgi:hypothetical protein